MPIFFKNFKMRKYINLLYCNYTFVKLMINAIQNTLAFDTTVLHLPSPIERFYLEGIGFDVKRDDKINEIISGNKWRKLKYIIAFAKQNKYKTLISFGGAFSTHLLALAYAAKHFGLHSVGVVRGDEGFDNSILNACKTYGMNLHFVSRKDYDNKDECAELIKKTYPIPLIIEEGGANNNALKGVAEIVDEIATESPLPYQHILLAVGTGTTFAGIQLALRTHCNTTTQLHGILCIKTDSQTFLTTQKLIEPLRSSEQLHDTFHFGGYAKKNSFLQNFIHDFHVENNNKIQLEPIYTGKVLWALKELISQKIIPKNDRILLLHTGGLFYLNY